tara:strand:- start:2522 stop:3376 length:855 start_codon:yes stop_codon:yes gene_type:complete
MNTIVIAIPGLVYGGYKSNNFTKTLEKLQQGHPDKKLLIVSSTWDSEYNSISDLKVLCNNLQIEYIIEKETYSYVYDNLIYDLINDTTLLKNFVFDNSHNFIDKLRKRFAFYYKIFKCYEIIKNKDFNYFIRCKANRGFYFYYNLDKIFDYYLHKNNKWNCKKNNMVLANITIFTCDGYVDLEDTVMVMHSECFKKLFSKFTNVEQFLKEILSIYENNTNFYFNKFYIENRKNFFNLIQDSMDYTIQGSIIWGEFFKKNYINICSSQDIHVQPYDYFKNDYLLF